MTTSYDRSVEKQKFAGTYNRNLHIKELRGYGFTLDSIGKRYNLCRERIRQIANNPFVNQTHQNEHRGGFIARLKEWVSKWLRKEIQV